MRTIYTDRVEHHDVPEIWSDQRQHVLDPYCWCRPEVVRITRRDDGSLEEVEIVHRAPVPAEGVPA